MAQSFFRRFDFLVTAGCIALLGYFVWVGLEGPRGVSLRDKLVVQQQKLDGEHLVASDTRKALERRVSQLRPESVDADLADEMARRELSMGRSNEYVVQIATP